MSKPVSSEPQFHTEEAAYAFVEARIWPNGPVCPHCANKDRIGKLNGKTTRIGLYKCYACQKPFTVKIGTIFEDSHLPLRLWLQAIYHVIASKKGISSDQLHRTLGITLKSAWFMSHRIREAMRNVEFAHFGGNGGTVEADETFLGNEPGKPIRHGYGRKRKVLSLVDRESGDARSIVIDYLKTETVTPILRETPQEKRES